MSTSAIKNTILDDWREQERDGLTKAYDAVEAIVRHPEGAVPLEMVRNLAGILGVHNCHITAGEANRTFIISLADGKLEVGNETARYEARVVQLQQWRDELSSKARWDRISEVDMHVIHMHMARLHGNHLIDLMRGSADGRGLVPYAIDTLESDELSVHLLSTRCEDVVSAPDLNASTSIETRRSIVERAIETIAENGPRWSNLPGMQRRGISVGAGMKSDEITIEGNTVTVSTKNFPESIQMADFNDKPLHEVIDLGGYRNNKLKIVRSMRIANREQIAFNINRNAQHMRVRLHIDPKKYR